MLEQVSVALNCVVQFTTSGVGATGLTVTCTVLFKENGSAWTTLVSSQSATEVGNGFYSYELSAGNNLAEGLILFVFTTAGTADLKDVGAGWAINKGGVERLDAEVSSRLAPTVAARTLDVSVDGEAGVDWANVGSPTTVVGLSGTTVKAVTEGVTLAASAVQAIWDALTSALTTVGSIGKLIVDSFTSALARLPAALVGGRIDASVGAMEPDVVTASAMAPDAIGASELAISAVSEIAAAIPAAPTVGAIADAVLDEMVAQHLTAGSVGAFLNASGTAADPLLNQVPGTYSSGTAGAALGRIGSGQITTVSPVAQDGTLTLTRGDDYSALDARAPQWIDASAAWPDLTGATIKCSLRHIGGAVTLFVGSVVTATGATKTVRIQPTSAQTKLLAPGTKAYRFDIESTLSSGRIVTLVLGDVNVLQDYTVQ